MSELKMANNRSTLKLLESTAIYMAGSMLSKLLNLVILPFISIRLTSEQYGIFDLIQTITSLVIPVFTLQVIEAAFRFVYLANKKEKRQILSNVWACILVGSVCFVGLLYSLNFYCLHLAYINYIIIYYIFNVLINMYQRIARCYNLNKVYALSGIIQTIVMLGFQFIFLHYFSFKEDGLVYAYAISAAVSCVYIEIKTHSLKTVSFSDLNINTLKRIICFSAPLIPNSISWWGVSSVNRLVIVAFIGYSANGIFSMSNKFASIITMIASTFQLAWQEFGMTEKDNPDHEMQFSNVFKHFFIILAFITSAAILFQQIFFNLLIDAKYEQSYYYIPIIMLSVAFSSINSFYGAGYFIFEKTKGAFKTTVIGALLNIVICFITVKPFGLWGIASAGVMAYFIMCIIRHFTMKKYFNIYWEIKSMIISVSLITVSIIIYYVNYNIISVVTMLILGVMFFMFYKKNLMIIVNNIRTGDNHELL